jgi:hypothetical protein
MTRRAAGLDNCHGRTTSSVDVVHQSDFIEEGDPLLTTRQIRVGTSELEGALAQGSVRRIQGKPSEALLIRLFRLLQGLRPTLCHGRDNQDDHQQGENQDNKAPGLVHTQKQ